MRAPIAFAAASALLVSMIAGPAPALAACKRFGFTVNDYGKEGPIRDAKALLDKHVAEWAAKSGITNYKIGKKDVSCELFLNFIVFDEHTCTASANVCWGADQSKAAGGDEETFAEDGGSPPPPVRKAAKDGAKAKTQEAAHDSDTAKEDTKQAEAPAEDDMADKPVVAETPAAAEPSATGMPMAGMSPTDVAPPASELAEEEKVAAPAKSEKSEERLPGTDDPGVVVETGALGSSAAQAPAEKSAPALPPVGPDKAKAAAAASEAAAAAERAAAAAETAANAAKEAAAAAVAASNASRGTFVPPLSETAQSKSAGDTAR